jgi:hypothetical protein
VVVLDARPSDSIAMAVQQGAPLFVARSVFDSVEDVTDTLAQIEKRGLEQPAGDEGLSEEQEDIDPDDLDLEGLELDEEDDDEDDEEDEDFDDGYQGNDDDDDEGEEWKKSDG